MKMKKKIAAILMATMFSSAALSDGLVGLRLGSGSLDGSATEDVGGSTTVSHSKSVSSEFGSIFAEGTLPVEQLPFKLNIGIDYIPLTANLQHKDGNDANSGTLSAEVKNHLTIYLSPRHDFGDGMTVFGKIGYSQADISQKGATVDNGRGASVITGDGDMSGWTVGLGIEKQIDAGGYLDFLRAEVQYTDYNSLSYTSTKTGHETKNHTADLDTTTLTIGVGKKF